MVFNIGFKWFTCVLINPHLPWKVFLLEGSCPFVDSIKALVIHVFHSSNLFFIKIFVVAESATKSILLDNYVFTNRMRFCYAISVSDIPPNLFSGLVFKSLYNWKVLSYIISTYQLHVNKALNVNNINEFIPALFGKVRPFSRK